MREFGFSIHGVKADETAVTAHKTPRETWWVSLDFGHSSITIFAASAADFEEILTKLKEGVSTVKVIE